MRLITKCYRYPDLVPSLLRHYFRLGYEDIHIATDPKTIPYLHATCPKEVHLHPAFRRGYTSTENSQAVVRIQRAVASEKEWIGICDLDEFHAYPLPLLELVAALEANGANTFVGKLVDHVSNDGSLLEIGDKPFEQFPIMCNLTEALAKGCGRKVMLVKGFLDPADGGYHFAIGERPARLKGVIHHFKWTSNLIARLRLRLADSSAVRAGSRPESERILAHFAKHRRLVLQDIPNLKRFANIFEATEFASKHSLTESRDIREPRR